MSMIKAKSDLPIIDLSDNMHCSKVYFLAYINYFYPTDSLEYEDASFLIRNKSDIERWLEFWDGNQENIHQTNELLREWRIQQMLEDDDFDEFRDLMHLDEQDWLESYYQQPYTKRTQYEINRVLDEMTVEQIWQIHRQYPLARIEYY